LRSKKAGQNQVFHCGKGRKMRTRSRGKGEKFSLTSVSRLLRECRYLQKVSREKEGFSPNRSSLKDKEKGGTPLNPVNSQVDHLFSLKNFQRDDDGGEGRKNREWKSTSVENETGITWLERKNFSGGEEKGLSLLIKKQSDQSQEDHRRSMSS